MELQYHSTSRDPVSWAPLRFPSRGQNDTTRGYRERQGQWISGNFDHMEDQKLHRTTAASSNSAFSDSDGSRSSRFKHIVIPEPNRAFAQYTGHESLHRGTTYWDHAHGSQNGFAPSPSFDIQNLNKLHGVSYKNELPLNNRYNHLQSESFPPRKKYKGTVDSDGSETENTVSAFKRFNRDDINNQFSRMKERNKNLPPPPPLVKASEKMNKNSKPEMMAREDVIVICDTPPPPPPPPPPPKKCQFESREDPLRDSKLETIPRETLHHSKPISSAKVNKGMEHPAPISVSNNYNPRDVRESMGHMQSCDCHHHDNMSRPSTGFANDRIRGAKATQFFTFQHATRSHYEPHSGIQCHSNPNCHNGVSYSSTTKTSGLHKNNHPKNHKIVDSPSPLRNAPPRTFCDTHDAMQAWRMKSQLTEISSNSQSDSTFFADVLRNNTKSVPSNLSQSRIPNRRDDAFRDLRQFKDYRSQTPIVRSQINRAEDPAVHTKPEYPCQQSKELPLFNNQKISQLSKTDHAKFSKFLESYGHNKDTRKHQLMVTKQPTRVPEIYFPHNIQKLPLSQYQGSQSPSSNQTSNYEQKQETMHSLLMSASSRESTFENDTSASVTNFATDKVVVSRGYADPAFISPLKGHISSHLPIYSSPTKGYSISPENVVTRGKPEVMAQVTSSSNRLNSDHLSNSIDEKVLQDENIRAMPTKSSTSRSPPSYESYRKSLMETEKQKLNSLQPKSYIGTEASLVQKNHVALFQPPKSRRLSYPLESNHLEDNRSQENSSTTLHRSKSEGDQEDCENDVSPLLKNFKEDTEETIVQSCGGYAFDHDSLPIIVAVHSIVVKKDSLKETKSNQEEETKGEIPTAKKDAEIMSSYGGDSVSNSKHLNTSTRYQGPILPKLDTMSEQTNYSSEEVHVSGVPSVSSQVTPTSSSTSSSSLSSPSSLPSSLPSLIPKPPSSSSSSSSLSSSSSSSSSSVLPSPSLSSFSLPPPVLISSSPPSSAAAKIEQLVNSVCTISNIAADCNDDKQIRSKAINSTSTDSLSSNEVILVDQATQAVDTTRTINTDSATSVSSDMNTNGSSRLPKKSDEEVDKSKTSKLVVHRRHSVEELSNKIVETRERIDKEEIDWKKKLLHRLEYVLIKKIKKAEKETGEKASIDLTPAEKNAKGKDEQKKTKKRTKSCSDDNGSKVELEEKDTKEKCKEATQKSPGKTNEGNNDHRQKKRHKSKNDISNDSNVDKESTSTTVSRKESLDSMTINQEEITAGGLGKRSLASNDEIPESSLRNKISVEECGEVLSSSPSTVVEDEGFEDFGSSDLVIAE